MPFDRAIERWILSLSIYIMNSCYDQWCKNTCIKAKYAACSRVITISDSFSIPPTHENTLPCTLPLKNLRVPNTKPRWSLPTSVMTTPVPQNKALALQRCCDFTIKQILEALENSQNQVQQIHQERRFWTEPPTEAWSAYHICKH